MMRAVLFACFVSVAAPAVAQDNVTNGAAAETANRAIDKKGLGLSPEQGQLIAKSTESEKHQAAPDPLSIGVPVPDAMMLAELPVELKDRIGLLRDFKFARIDNDAVILVDPTSRVVVEVIRK